MKNGTGWPRGSGSYRRRRWGRDAQVVEVAARRSAWRLLTRAFTARNASVMPMMAPMTEPAITTSHRPALMPMLCWNSSLTSPIAKPAP